MKKWLLIIFLIIIFILAILLIPKKEGEMPIFIPKEENIKIKLFFSDEDCEFLTQEERTIPKKEKEEDIARLIIAELLKGPTVDGFISVIPDGTRLRELYIYEGVLYLDFSSEISKNHPGGSRGEILTIFSIVNTLCFNLPQFPVMILIEGKEQETLAGHIALDEPFIFNKDIVKN